MIQIPKGTSSPALIGIDWGSTNLRSFLFDDSGLVIDELSVNQGISQISQELLADTFHRLHAQWLATKPMPILMAGMAGSIGGFKNTTYLTCPTTLEELAKALEPIQLDGSLTAYIVPGFRGQSVDGTPDVMRGEEIQILGALDRSAPSDSLFCLPGTHSKWVQLEAGHRVISLTTYITGELFALLTQHGSLARWAQTDDKNSGTFESGLRQAQRGLGLAHQLFSIRSKVLVKELEEHAVRSYLSGLLIGTEVAQMLTALKPRRPIHLIGDPMLTQLYHRALQCAGYQSKRSASASTAAAGLYRVATLANLLAA